MMIGKELLRNSVLVVALSAAGFALSACGDDVNEPAPVPESTAPATTPDATVPPADETYDNTRDRIDEGLDDAGDAIEEGLDDTGDAIEEGA
ncbi:MAG TPA: hypothetical protein VIK87_07230, partial [Sphingomonadales bacterium]